MSRLTEKEIDLIQSARAARRHEPAGAEHFVEKARALQSEATAEMTRGLLVRTGLAEFGAWLYRAVVCPIAAALHRRRTVRQLSRLDDHLLRDIGLERGMLESFGETLSARMVAPSRAIDGPFARCRSWLRRRRTVRELEALSDRQLADIGILRGQIEETVDRALRAAPACDSAVRRAVTAAGVEARTYVALKVDPPLRPKAARRIEAANESGPRILPLWIGPWLPARHRDAA